MALPQPKPQSEPTTAGRPETNEPVASSLTPASFPLFAKDRGPANELISSLSLALAEDRAFSTPSESEEARWPLLKTFLVLGAAGSFCWLLIGVAAYLIF